MPSSMVRLTVQSRSCDRRTASGGSAGGVTALPRREHDPEGHLDIRQVIARCVADFLRRHVDLEGLGLRPP